ncbi:phage tail assembly protein [Pseudomonas schmalbachii]|uniref:Phage tail assembly protein n=1 Tax=Pseudomonas schmalbachii TaxID=2816993 RepID=A0ABS3TKG6_9PSED|nr:phage tail assembly protein [Pseudomonas schmalbachii]MBO3274128.1 phage tail assembly protein [Pseudomonas schmalbachii]
MSRLQSVTVPLIEPIQFGSETITELTLKRVKFKHLRQIPDLQHITTDELGHLIERISGQPKAVIDELDGEDLDAISEHLAKILPAGR